MGLLQQLEQEARNLKPRKTGGKFTAVTQTTGTESLIKLFPVEMKNKVLRKAVRQTGRLVQKQTKANLQPHQSEITGTSKGWTKEVRERRSDRQMNLADSIAVKVKTYDDSVASFTGPRWPWGNHGYLLEFGWLMQFWGRESGQFYNGRARGYMRRATGSTLSQQKQTFIQTVKKEWTKI